MQPDPNVPAGRPAVRFANPASVAWVIAWRHIKESLHNRTTYLMAAFYLALPLVLVLLTVGPTLRNAGDSAEARTLAGSLMAVYMLMAGMLPATWSVGIASGAFAAEKEQGSLVPLLATPASNASIFAGKVLGSVIPAISLGAIALLGYLIEIAIAFGPASLRLLPVTLSLLIVALVPAMSLLGAAVSSLISARVNTEQTANQYGSLILTLIWLLLFGVILRAAAWGMAVFGTAVAVIYVLAIGCVAISAATWRREEVMARR